VALVSDVTHDERIAIDERVYQWTRCAFWLRPVHVSEIRHSDHRRAPVGPTTLYHNQGVTMIRGLARPVRLCRIGVAVDPSGGCSGVHAV
jgi:hypothetical protein